MGFWLAQEAASWLVDTLLDLGKDKGKTILNRQKLKAQLDAYAMQYFAGPYQSLMPQEEFDLTLLNRWLKTYYADIIHVQQEPRESIRRQLEQELIHRAYAAISGEQQSGRFRVWKWIQNLFHRSRKPSLEELPQERIPELVAAYMQVVFDLVRHWLLEGGSPEQKTLSRLVTDAVTGELSQELSQMKNELLERLAYKDSFAELIDNLPKITPRKKAFYYRNPDIGFYGREAECARMDAFRQAEAKVAFWIVSGNAGFGKSKFVYEYMRLHQMEADWHYCELREQQLRQILSMYKWDYPCHLFLAVDYAGTVAEQIGDWLSRLPDDRPYKLRIVLIERQTKVQRGQDWIFTDWMQKLYGTAHDRRYRLEQLCYSESPLPLGSLSETAYGQMMDDYAKSQKKAVLSQQTKAELYAQAQQITSGGHTQELCSPLVLLFMTDACLQGRSCKEWDLNAVMNYMLEKYQRHWETVVCQGDTNLYLDMRDLLVYATASGGWQVGMDLGEPLTQAVRRLHRIQHERGVDALSTLITGYNETASYDGILYSLEPDLIGEYFVLRYMVDHVFTESGDDTQLAQWQELLWSGEWNPAYAVFLDRCITDYGSNQKEGKILQRLMDPDTPAKLIQDNAQLLAMCLVNLSNKQEEVVRKETVERLRKLSEEKWPENEGIAVAYASSLFNLSVDQEETRCQETVESLRKLSEEKWRSSEEIAIEYAKNLVNLSAKQELAGCQETVEKLRKLSEEKWPESEEIAVAYASSLTNLSAKQEESDCQETVESLRKLSEEKWRSSEEIAIGYAKNLVNLSAKQEESGCKETAECLRKLSEEKWSESKRIAEAYAKSLFNLSNKQEETDRKKTAERLQKLSEERWSENEEIAVEYAKSLFNISFEQEEAGRKETVESLRKLSEEKWSGSEKIAVAYASSLLNLTFEQEEAGRKETVESLRKLSEERWPESEEIAVAYALSLYNLTVEQEEASCQETVESLRKLSEEKWRSSEEIAVIYAKSLTNLSAKQELAGCQDTVESLRKLSEEKWRSSEEIAVEYASSLRNLTVEQELAGCQETVESLRKLSEEKWPESEEIAVEYASSLMNLTVKQELAGCQETVESLRKLSEEKWPGSKEIGKRYAYGLYILVLIQSQAEGMETLAVLDQLIARFQEDFLLPDESRTVRMLAWECVSQKDIRKE